MFDPRRDVWRAHFRWDGVRVVGITPTGRATVMALHMNRPLVLAIREEENELAQKGIRTLILERSLPKTARPNKLPT